MNRPNAEVTLIGHTHVKAHWELRDFLTRIAQPHNWLEAGKCSIPFPEDKLPAVLVPAAAGGEIIAAASVRKVAEEWGIRRQPESDKYDLAILGAGPSGLAAAVYAASDGLKTIVVETDLPGGQASYTAKIENFFGFPEGIGGAELTQLAMQQAYEFGAEVCSLAPAIRVYQEDEDQFGFMVHCAKDEWKLRADQVVASTGMQWRKMHEIDGLNEVHYGAGRSEVIHSVGADVAIIGGGNSAGQAAMSFAEAGANVKLLVRGGDLFKSMSQYLAERVDGNRNIDVQLNSQVVGGGESRRGLELQVQEPQHDPAKGHHRVLSVDKAFICIGGAPRTSWATGLDLIHEKGFLKTGPDLLQTPQAFWEAKRPPTALETSVPGLFAAGDVRWGASRRVGGAVGEGSAVVALAHRVRS